jgi:hypothetical protein
MEEGKLLEIIIKNQYLGEIPVLELYSINDTGIKAYGSFISWVSGQKGIYFAPSL